MKGSAPKSSLTGFQAVFHKNDGPNFWMAGCACRSRTSTISTRAVGTMTLTARVTARKPSGREPRRASRPVRTAVDISVLARLFFPTVQPVADAAHRRDVERHPAHELLAQPADVH